MMTFQVFFNRVLSIAFVIVLTLALWFFRNTLLLTLAAVIIAVGLSIPANWLRRRGWSRAWAIAATVVVVTLAVVLLLLWLVPSITSGFGSLLTTLPQTLTILTDGYNTLRSQNSLLRSVLPALESTTAPSLSEEELRTLLERALQNGLPILVSGGGAVVSVLTNLALVLVMAVLFLVDPTTYVKASLYLVTKNYRGRLLELWGELYHSLKTWLSSLFISITITVTLVLVVLGLLRMPNVLVVAVFAGFATFVPNIGAFLPLIPIALFTLADDPAKFLIMAPAYLAIQLLESNVLTPSIVKRQLSIPAAGMFVFQIIAGIVFGVLGVLLAVPLLAIIITLVRELYSYDVLGLRGERLEVALTRESKLSLQEVEGTVKPARGEPKDKRTKPR
jgi:predicted PurR-regulated permease PerM